MILGLDTATADTAVAVLDGERVVHEILLGPGPDGRPAHGRALLPAIEEAVGVAGGWSVIDRLGVGVGPGSFTGLRIGIATARALAQARGLPIAALPTTDALLAGLAERPEAGDRVRLAVVDARRGEVFAALATGPEPGEPAVAAPGELETALAVGSGELRGALAAGDGSLRFRSELEAAGVVVLAEGDPAHRVSARLICTLAATIDPGPVEGVRPMYLRRPDAERWLERNRSN